MKKYNQLLMVFLLSFCFDCANENKNKEESDYFGPVTVSKEAGEAIRDFTYLHKHKMPAPDDFEAWRLTWEYNEKEWQEFNDSLTKEFHPSLIETTKGGLSVIDVLPENWKDNGKILVYTHGGAYTLFSAKTMLMGAVPVAARTGLRVISVNYTNPPFAKYTEIIDQVIAVIQALVEEGYDLSNIGIYGDSAGGALAAGTVLKMRDMKMGMPAVVVLISPWSDISESGDTYHTLKDADPILNYEKSLGPSSLAYAPENEHKNPYVSPVYADYTKGFPPTMIQGGTKEIFLSNFVRQYQAMDQAGIPVKLDLYEGMWHVFQEINYDLPESITAHAKMNSFLKKYLNY